MNDKIYYWFFLSEMLEHVERRLFSNGKPINSTVSLINADFRIAGEIMSMSVLQGGPAPTFMNADVYKYITKQALTVKELPESKYKEIAKVVCCNRLETQFFLFCNMIFEDLLINH